MAAALDDEELALSISASHTRRGSVRSPDVATESPRPAMPREKKDSTASQRVANQRLGQYQILETLGEGSFGKVKLAVHQVSGQKVALKIIPRKKLMARDMAGRIEREIQYLQLLRHPHIIKLYTVITTPSEIIMVLEYAGSELFEYIVKHGRMQEDKARQFFQQMVCAVEYCHRHKIVHRDLKPENLLLDENLHVKIADFGLSNIMTDGNFLKTSCGSPNYAAPEVISGKLYAGPEVDVWSCGVILYVLLVGRLPFDDDYIPALFKKIAQGQYHEPHYLSPGAKRLIKKMLQISPVQRITVQEIRNDPWFMKNLPDYLQPTVEEFWDTGIDVNKAIDPRSLAPGKPEAVQAKIHDSVVGKLGATMGYKKEDVAKALAKDEPNAIKDAYFIVRENQFMKATAKQEPSLQPFLAQSPTVASPIATFHAESLDAIPKAERAVSSPLATANRDHGRPDVGRMASAGTTASSIGEMRSPVNTIGVLPSSLPDYHRAYMAGRPPPSADPTVGDQSGFLDAAGGGTVSGESPVAAARRLKPHSRSQINLEKMHKPEAMTLLAPTTKKLRPTKWQFGIRSRNPPAEAMLAIYKALSAMGADWEVPRIRKAGKHHGGSDGTSHRDGGSTDTFSDSDEDETSDDEEARYNHTDSSGSALSGAGSRGRERGRHGPHNDWGYSIPDDPWVINARFKKGGMFPPGITHPSSTNSSLINLSEAATRRRGSSLNSLTSQTSVGDSAAHAGPPSNAAAAERNASLGGSGNSSQINSLNNSNSGSQSNLQSSSDVSKSNSVTKSGYPHADESAYVYMTIQLYSIEKEFYLVDFKCAGYEKLNKHLVKEIMAAVDVNADGTGSNTDKKTTGPGVEELRGRVIEGSLEQGPRGDVFYERVERGDDFDDDEVKEEYLGEGRATEEKEVSSPFPFLDVASRLIIQLAEAD